MPVPSPLLGLDIPQLLSNLVHPETTFELEQAQRLFHGRGYAYDNLHHITIDWLPPVILITLFEPVVNSDLEMLARILQNSFSTCESIQVQHRHQKHWPVDLLFRKTITHLDVLENKLKFKLKLGEGRNTGLFLDMKNGRNWIRSNSQSKRVLNLFAYTCGFSVAAIAGGARSVYNIDISSPVLSTGRENHLLNNQSLDNVKFEKLNIFKSFGRIKKRGPYDLLICDPPTFQKGSIDIVRDYPKILRKLNEFMSPSSELMLCINAPHLGQKNGGDFLIECMNEYAPEFQLGDVIKPPSVYIETENKGMKTLIFKKGNNRLSE